MSTILINNAEYPIVVLTLPLDVEAADVDDLSRRMDGVYKKAMDENVRVVVVVDATRMRPAGFSAGARLRFAQISDESLKKYPNVRLGEAVVSTSTAVRAVLKAHNLFRRTPLEQKICPSLADAKAWAKTLLAQKSRS